MEKILSILRLEPLKGSRTQYTLLIGIVVNALVKLGYLHLTPEEIKTTNEFLTMAGMYFFADKVSK